MRVSAAMPDVSVSSSSPGVKRNDGLMPDSRNTSPTSPDSRQRVPDPTGFVVQGNSDGDTAVLSHEGRNRAEEERAQLESDSEELDTREQQEVEKMQRRDQEVRQHEQAHIAASGRLAVSGPVYQMEQGPDGRMYVTEGHVNFRTPPTQSPREKLELAEQLRRMALAPANPSGKDRSVAAQAARQISEARMAIIAEKQEEIEDRDSEPTAEEVSFEVHNIGGQLQGS